MNCLPCRPRDSLDEGVSEWVGGWLHVLASYLVSTALGPRALACILSITMCLSFW